MNKPYIAISELTKIIYIVDGKEKYDVTEQAIKAVKALEQEPKTVPLNVYEQIKWERDVAIEQLKELGYELGEKVKQEPCEDCISRAKAEMKNYSDTFVLANRYDLASAVDNCTKILDKAMKEVSE